MWYGLLDSPLLLMWGFLLIGLFILFGGAVLGMLMKFLMEVLWTLGECLGGRRKW